MDLVSALESLGLNRVQLEKKLLLVGYRREDSLAYSRKMVLLEPALVFPVERVPQVRQVDRGVIEVHYRVELDETTALDSAAAEIVLRAVGLSRNWPTGRGQA